MALFHLDIRAEGRQAPAFALTDASPDEIKHVLENEQHVYVEAVEEVPDHLWFVTDAEGVGSVMVTLGQSGDTEFGHVMSFPETEMDLFGTEQTSNLLTDAGVSAGYREAAEAVRRERALNEDDYARIATALGIAWQNLLTKAADVGDPDAESVLRGMAGAYNGTLAKVERILGE